MTSENATVVTDLEGNLGLGFAWVGGLNCKNSIGLGPGSDVNLCICIDSTQI